MASSLITSVFVVLASFTIVQCVHLSNGAIFTFDNVTDGIEDSDVRRIVQDFIKLCPGMSLCHVEAPFEAEFTPGGITVPCCGFCRCDEACFDTHDCCPDILPNALETSDIKEKYASLTTCEVTELRPGAETWDKEGFSHGQLMVSKCPRDYDNVAIKEKCEIDYAYIVNSSVDFMEVVPITDLKTEITYRNLLCMKCNIAAAHTLFLKWETSVDCEQSHHLPLNRYDVIRSLGPCHLIFKLPEVKYERPCTRAIDRCNVTGTYVNSSEFMTSACASYTSYYKGYKNVHCYICNGNSEQSVEDKCKYTTSFHKTEFIGVFDLDGILDDVTDTREEDKRCGIGSKYDTASVSKHRAFWFKHNIILIFVLYTYNKDKRRCTQMEI